MLSDDPLSRMWMIHCTCVQMLEDRGYRINDGDFTQQSFEARFKRDFGFVKESRCITATSMGDEKSQIMVYFPDESKKTGVKPIRDLVVLMSQNPNLNRAILVTQVPITSFARDAIQAASSEHVIEAFVEFELLCNITRHELVPRHIPLSADEKDVLLRRYKIKEASLPRMVQTDPVARYFGLRQGNVVKIIRPSETAGRYVTYRLVV